MAMDLNFCALNTGPDYHLLDHIAPLASLLSIPLLVTETENAELARKYYPEVAVQFEPEIEQNLNRIASRYDGLIECKFWQPHLKTLLRTLFGRDVHLVFCPHGHSDKGYQAPLLAPYTTQDSVLLYGNLQRKMLTEQGLWDFVPNSAFIGNYRYQYYCAHQIFLDECVEREIFSRFDPCLPTLFYAPTWNDADQASSFFHYIEILVRQLPSHWNLLVKVHPLLIQRQPAHYERLMSTQKKKKNYLVIDQFPPVLPILRKIDAYLGDYSSVGYDALAFQKPMFFFTNPKLPAARLHQCGQTIQFQQSIFEEIEKGLTRAHEFSALQKRLYQEAFDPAANVADAIQSLMAAKQKQT